MAADEKCIGRLTLDTSKVDKAIKHVNDKLKEIGVGIKVDLSDKVSAEVKKQLDGILKDIEKYEKRMSDAVDKVINSATEKTGKKIDDKNLKEAINLWKQYYELMTKAQRAENSGKKNESAYYKQEADAIKEKAVALKDEVAIAKELEKVRRSYNAAVEAGKDKQAAQEIRENAKAQKELTKEIEKSAQARKKAEETAFKQELQDEANIIEALVELYRKKAQMDTEATKAVASGNVDNANLYLQEEAAIQKTIDAIKELYPELDKVAKADERVAEAELKRQAAVNTAKQKAEITDYKEKQEAVDKYANALVTLYNKQTEINNAMAKGALKEGTQEYEDAQAALERCAERAREAGNNLKKMGVDADSAVSGIDKVQDAAERLVQSEDRLAVADTEGLLAKIKQQYFELTDAIKNYNAAKKSGDETGMATAQARIDAAMQEVSAIQEIVDKSNIEASVKQQILNYIQQCTTAEHQHVAEVNRVNEKTGELESQVKGLVTRYLSLMAVIRAISSLMSNMVEYVTEYSDKMNEIQMITLKTNDEVSELSERYREISRELNASSLDIADAAVYFTRQGMQAADIEKRLVNVTKYAKAANVEFKDASEIFTAVINSMGLMEQEAEDGRDAAQRVADVFLMIGDNAATSGQEIGEAMQKAAASAGAFGVSMEWLASWIAAVSETTRQEARTIGTAFNTIIARLHQIKSTGYNSEDETKINDIAKALSKIDVALMDQEGNWRDMEDIMIDIASKWDTLDDKTKSYIATTMAGVKQQNVFLALMNDMSKGAESGSRAFELHGKAMNSDGVAAEKYAVYLDSVTAAQERLTIAQENFYSSLDKNVIKAWYDSLAGIVNWIADATRAFGGLNIILPVVGAGIYLVVKAIQALNAKIAVTGSLLALLEKHPIILAISAIVAGITLLTGAASLFVDQSESVAESFDNANAAIEESQTKLEKYMKVQEDATKMFANLGDKATLTAEDIDEYNDTLEEIAEISPFAKHVVDELRAGFIDQQQAAELLNKELERLAENEENVSMNNLIKRYATYQNGEYSLKDIAGVLTQMDNPNNTDRSQSNEMRFRNALSYNYRNNQLSDELETYIQNQLNALTKDDAMTTDQAWDIIAGDLLYMWFDQFDFPDDATDKLAKQVEEEIDYIMSIIGKDLDPTEFVAVRKNLYNAIFGSDGKLSSGEYEQFSGGMARWLRDYALNGKDEIIKNISDFDMAEAITEALFGDELYFGNRFSNMGEKAAHDFVETYKQFVQEGFSNDEIAEIMTGMSQKDWEEGILYYRRQLEEILKEDFGTDFLGQKIYTDDGNGNLSLSAKRSLLWDQVDTKTLQTIHDMAQEGIVDINDVNRMMLKANGDTEEFVRQLTEYGEQFGFVFEDIDADDLFLEKTFETIIKDVKNMQEEVSNLDDYIAKLEKDGHLDSKDLIDLTTAHPELLKYTNDMDLLLNKLKELRSNTVDGDKGSLIGSIRGSSDLLQYTPFARAAQQLGATTIDEYIDKLEPGSRDLAEVTKWLDETADNLLSGAEALDEATETWLETQRKAAEAEEAANWAKSNGYIEQVAELQNALNNEGAERALEIWNSYDESMRESISETYPSILKAMSDVERALEDTTDKEQAVAEATETANKAFDKTRKYLDTKYFKETADAILKLEKGTISATDAYEVFSKELENVRKAGEDITEVQTKIADGEELAASDVANLASVLGMTADEVLSDVDGAIDKFDELIGETGDMQAAFDALNKAAFIRITGVSEADFSNIENGLLAVGDMAEETIKLLQATGQWEVEEIPLNGFVSAYENGRIVKKNLPGKQKVLRATGNNPYAGYSRGVKTKTTGDTSGGRSSGGGGGGSNRDTNQMTEVERMLDRMEQMNAIHEYQQSYYQAEKNYYNQTGQLQGVMGYEQKEIDLLKEQSDVLEDNISKIEKYIAIKKSELSSLSTSDERYEEVADDLDKLQKAHQNYTKQLIENKTTVDQLTKAIEEQKKKIRQMEIDLRNTILKAIEDREKRTEKMLNAEIEMQNTILDLIKRRYEKERDHIIETTNMKIDALNEEKNLLSEQLELRKQQAEEEDKAAELAQLEAQYQRIIADPTRRKEALEIQKQITDLREEMAWDAAEKEVKAQQDSIDQQVTSLEDYIEYVENYYEDLFEHPQKLIEEMREILKTSDEEIIEWLQNNSDEFAASTEETQAKMVTGWQDTLNDMHDIIKTHWEEVESIIAMGEDYIINFLKENSEDYRQAGKLQAEAYVDEWAKQLEDLRLAHQQVAVEAVQTYAVIEKAAAAAASAGGGGGGGGSYGSGEGLMSTALNGVLKAFGQSSLIKTQAGTILDMFGSGSKKNNVMQTSFKAYATGGVAQETGPAWLDKAERVLNPYQTQLFETMVEALERIGTVSISSMPNYGNAVNNAQSQLSFGDIVVNVDNLDTDDDYEELAEKVSEVLMERIGRTAVVGGLRIRSI